MTTGHPGRLLVGAGIVTWVVAGLPTIATWLAGARIEPRAAVWCVAYIGFALAFWIAVTSSRLAFRRIALAVQSVCALADLAVGTTGFDGALLCVIAGEAPLVVGEGSGLVWVIAQAAAMLAIEIAVWGNVRAAYFSTAAYGGFQLFAFGASRLAAREMAARSELARVHAELLATQELFADSTRTAERVRIARELHDALGHHLTALSLQLEVARNVAEGRVKEPVDRAHGLTKELLAELRSVVDAMREDAPIDLARALRTLVVGIPHPRVHVDVREDLRLDAALAHAIFRCVQEALTNTVRHADAANVYLSVTEQGGTVTFAVRDDGRGAFVVKSGHGLTGVRERIEGLGGSVEVVANPGEGLTVRASVPSRGGT